MQRCPVPAPKRGPPHAGPSLSQPADPLARPKQREPGGAIPGRLLVLVAGVAALAVTAIAACWSGPASPNFWFWFGVCLLGEVMWVRLPVGGATVTMASCFHVAVLLLLERGDAMAIVGITGLLAEYAILRKPPIRAVFNAAQATLAVGAASLVLDLLIRGAPNPAEMVYGPHPGPLLAAVAVYFAINTGTVSLAVAIHQRIGFGRAWIANFGSWYEVLSNGALFSLGALLASHCATNGTRGTLLLAMPVLLAYEGYRRYVQARRAAFAPSAEEKRAEAA